MEERHLEVTRTARYCVLGAEVERPAEVWYVLHGYRQLAGRFLRRFAPLADGTRLVVAPEGLSRFYVEEATGRHGPRSVVGATWMTREDRENEIRDYVAYLDRLAAVVSAGLPGGADPGVTVLGFSQGVATASRWATYGAIRPERLILWGDYLPPDLDMPRAAEALADVDLVFVRGSGDRTLREDLAAEEAARIERAGIAHRRVAYEGGHEIDAPTLRALAGR